MSMNIFTARGRRLEVAIADESPFRNVVGDDVPVAGCWVRGVADQIPVLIDVSFRHLIEEPSVGIVERR